MTINRYQGIPASPGIAIGTAFIHIQPELLPPCRKLESQEIEIKRLTAACDQAVSELTGLYERVLKTSGEEDAAIFTAHIQMVNDPALKKLVVDAIHSGETVEQSVCKAIEILAQLLASSEGELFASRAVDIRDVGRRILRILLELPDTSLINLSVPSIILANDLTPSDTVGLDPALALGFCTIGGGLTSHTAIIARTLGIPAIVAIRQESLLQIPAGSQLTMDGESGVLLVSPEEEMIRHYQEKSMEQQAHLKEITLLAGGASRTADGRPIEVAANIGNVESANDALANHADGVGLLRTEFLYLDANQPPSEEQQILTYREIFKIIGNRPMIVRTLDIGGDKPTSFLPFPKEMNPFLGWRAIRISLDESSLFKTQLRAILRAAEGYLVRIMFPMISSLDELRRANQCVLEAKAELEVEGLPFADRVPIGIMVETPAAAVLVDVLAQECDFFSLGTNDLTQYTLAVDRGNASVASLYQPLHPAVLRLIKQAIDLAHQKNKWIGMCGELAGMKNAIPILLGLGLDEFSMSPKSIPEAKYLISRLTDQCAREIALEAIQKRTTEEVESYMKEVLSSFK